MRTYNGTFPRMPVRGGRLNLNCSVRPEVRARLLELATEADKSIAAYMADVLGEHVGMEA